jgi:DNA-binding NarL/FixJ family response regulator
MEKLHLAGIRKSPAQNFFQSLVVEQRGVTEELKALCKELQTVLNDLRAALRGTTPRRSKLVPESERLDGRHGTNSHNGLSRREFQVLHLIVDGKSSKEIAAELGISFKTAVTHRTSIMSKLDVHEIASVVREAIRRGLV